MGTRRRLLALLLQLACASSASGQFDVLSWTFDPDGSPGSQGTVTAATMTIQGPDGSPGCVGAGATASFTARAPVGGTVLVTAAFEHDSKFGGFDGVMLVVDGVESQVPSLDEQPVELALAVVAGRDFGFGVHSDDCLGGPGVLTLTDFRFYTETGAVVAQGSSSGEQFGAALANAGDVDGDGVDDLLVGAPLALAGGVASGRATLLSGSDGAILLESVGAAAGDEYGRAVAGIGDVNADGVPDLLVGTPRCDGQAPLATDAGAVRVISGAGGALLHELRGAHAFDRFGSAVCAVGDVDRDGRADFAVGVPFDDSVGSNAGKVLIVSGADGTLLAEFVGESAGERFGAALAPIEDVDGDGAADLIVGAPYADGAGLERGRFDVLSLSAGTRRSVSGAKNFEKLGWSVADAGDCDGDGVPDIVAGAPDYAPTSSDFRLGRAWLVSGADATVLFTVTGEMDNGRLGLAVAGAGDLDGSGLPDVLIGVPQVNQLVPPYMGEVRACSGQSGVLLHLLKGGQIGGEFGSAIARLGPARFAVGAPRMDGVGADAGEVSVSTIHVTWADLGHGLAGSTGLPSLLGHGLLVPGTPVFLDVQAQPLAPFILVVGLSAQYAPFKGGTLVPSIDLALAGLTTSGLGQWSQQASWPAALPGGLELFFQAWILDGGAVAGFAATNALRALTP